MSSTPIVAAPSSFRPWRAAIAFGLAYLAGACLFLRLVPVYDNAFDIAWLPVAIVAIAAVYPSWHFVASGRGWGDFLAMALGCVIACLPVWLLGMGWITTLEGEGGSLAEALPSLVGAIFRQPAEALLFVGIVLGAGMVSHAVIVPVAMLAEGALITQFLPPRETIPPLARDPRNDDTATSRRNLPSDAE